MRSNAKTVEEYLASLPEDRREALSAVRRVIKRNLSKGYEEGMLYGAIGYYIPHRIFPAGYHCDPKQPLPFAGIASQKNYMTLSLMCVYQEEEHERWFREAWKATGKKLDMGKSCVRFKKTEDVALEVVGEAVKRVPAKKFIENYQGVVESMAKRRQARKKRVSRTKPSAGSAKNKSSR